MNSVAVANEIFSLTALHRVVLCIYETKFVSHRVTELLSLQKAWLQAHKHAYGEHHLRPKCHYAWHLTKQVQTVGKLLDCFTAERKHKGYKALAAGNTSNQPDFAVTALLELVERELQSRPALSKQLHVELLGKPVNASLPGLNGPVLAGTGLNVGGLQYQKGSWVVLTEQCAVRVLAGVFWRADHYLLVQVYSCENTAGGLTSCSPYDHESYALAPPSELNRTARVVLFRLAANDAVKLLR